MKINPLYVIILVFIAIVGSISLSNNLAKSKAAELMKDPQILANHEKFLGIAEKYKIPFKTNEEALQVPAIKQVLAEREMLLEKNWAGCSVKYWAKFGPPSARYVEREAYCTPSWKWWK